MRRNLLLAWSTAFLATDLLHDLDHIRRANYSPVPVRALGFVALAGGVVAVALAASRHRFAAPYAVFWGITGSVGLIAVHVLPHWSLFSDPFTADRVDAVSWALIAAQIVVGFALAVAGFRQVRET